MTSLAKQKIQQHRVAQNVVLQQTEQEALFEKEAYETQLKQQSMRDTLLRRIHEAASSAATKENENSASTHSSDRSETSLARELEKIEMVRVQREAALKQAGLMQVAIAHMEKTEQGRVVALSQVARLNTVKYS